MKYIGNKTRLLDFINESIIKEGLPKTGIFIDIFSGTGSVGKYFKNKNLDFVDCILCAYAKRDKIITFDKKLNKCIEDNYSTPKVKTIFKKI